MACAQGTTVRLAIEMYPYATLSTSLLLVFFGFRRRKAEPRVFRASGARGSAASRFLGAVVVPSSELTSYVDVLVPSASVYLYLSLAAGVFRE